MSQPVPDSATAWWNLFSVFLFFGVIAGGIVVSIMIYFVRKYRYKEGQPEIRFEPSPLRFRVREAIVLASISGILLFSLAIVSYRATYNIEFPQEQGNSLTIDVIAFQWAFKFQYPNNFTTLGQCPVPSQRLVIFNVTSSDCFHNFALPDFKLKIDAIPGVYNTLAITPPSVGVGSQLNYTIRCYELCGVGHSFMNASLNVMEANAFDQWLNMTGG